MMQSSFVAIITFILTCTRNSSIHAFLLNQNSCAFAKCNTCNPLDRMFMLVKYTDKLESMKLLSYSDDKYDSSRSVGDYVKNLHGGKYNFGLGNVAGHEFADSLYASNTCSDEDKSGYINPDEDLPNWANKLYSLNIPSNQFELQQFITIKLGDTITIKNDERSWEKFYAFIIPPEDNVDFRIRPETGFLAPRGGASNACDETKPYLDSAELRVHQLHENTKDVCWIVIGTEETTWRYRLEK